MGHCLIGVVIDTANIHFACIEKDKIENIKMRKIRNKENGWVEFAQKAK